jgi:hypothetical protein
VSVAALFVDPKGAYSGLPDVEVWDEARDARLYPGPWPVVAHPPCERWGRYWYGQAGTPVGSPKRKKLGDDGGCFASALASVEAWGGVLEHPEGSAAWRTFGLHAPPRSGWVNTRKGWTCCVEQGHFGHRARKATWLYLVGAPPPSLRWGKAHGKIRLEEGFHSKSEREQKRQARSPVERCTGKERSATPLEFRDVLLEMARSVRAAQSGAPASQGDP